MRKESKRQNKCDKGISKKTNYNKKRKLIVILIEQQYGFKANKILNENNKYCFVFFEISHERNVRNICCSENSGRRFSNTI